MHHKYFYSYQALQADILDNLDAEEYTVQTSTSLLPKEIGEMKQLKSLRIISSKQMTGFPDEFKKLTQLEELSLEFGHFRELPPQVAALTNLKRLRLKYLKFSTDTINTWFLLNQLTNLEEIDITSLYVHLPNLFSVLPNLTQLKRLALSFTSNTEAQIWKQFPLLPNLEELILEYVLSNLERVPQCLWSLPKLRILNIQNNNLVDLNLPNKIKNTVLEELYLLGNKIATLPDDLAQLSKLNTLKVSTSSVESFPNVLLKFPHLEKLSISRRIEKDHFYYRLLDLERFFKYAKADQYSDKYKSVVFSVLKNKVYLKKIGKSTLLSLLECSLKTLQEEVLEELTARIKKGSFGERKPLKKGSKVVIKGKLAGRVSEIRAKLSNYEVLLGNKINATVTHVVLGSKPKEAYVLAQQYGCALLTEQLLLDEIKELEPDLLENDVVRSEEQLNNIRALLDSTDNSNIQLGLSLIQAGGIAKHFLTEIFLIYKNPKNRKGIGAKIHKQAKRLIEQHGNSTLKNVLKRRLELVSSWINEKTVEKNIRFYCDRTGLDPFILVKSLYKAQKVGVLYALHHLKRQEKIDFFTLMLQQENGKLLLRDYDLETLPNELTEINAVKILDISFNRFTSFPKQVYKFSELEELHYFRSYSTYRAIHFPKRLLQHKTLQRIYMNGGMIGLPSKEEQKRANCEIIIK
ncbi:MAG: hypothetical protein MK212_16045 [Saprospiraceae bacterium]|nr:hypothetical protein [Saprospiraceae bacterium]